MQLVAYGAQDIYLTGNPQITFFKVVYRRHTNFSMECIQQTLSGSSTIQATASRGTCTISRNGDLVSGIHVSVSADGITAGDAIITDAELEIGGQRIDKHTKEYNQVLAELSTSESKALGVKAMTGCIGTSQTTGVDMVQVPLNFWFCRNPGLALPLIALQYHEVKVVFNFGTTTDTEATAGDTVKVWVDYVYLDTDERRRFAQVSHEYLIEQLQYQDVASGKSNVSLNFNHPVKELIWTTPALNGYGTAKLVLNGHDRFTEQEEEYFQLYQPVRHHTAVPKQNLPSAAQLTTLDRQTQLSPDPPSAVGATTGLNIFGQALYTSKATSLTAGTGAEILIAGNQLHIASNVNMVTAANANLVEADLVGSQLAIQIIVATNLTGAVAGHTYFTTVTAVGSTQSGDEFHIILTVTPITSDRSTATVITASGAGTGTCSISRVTNSNSAQARTSTMTNKINCYSFALKPEEHQPSGTCNFSRIDNAQLQFTTGPTSAFTVYAVNYNVLRIMSGMGGLAYSN
jgi:hypothetical protein